MSMMLGIWDKLMNIVSGFFAIIPQTIYFIYASAASVVDMLQYVLRKLAGLDVYYIKQDGKSVAQTGDILSEFIESAVGIKSTYSVLSTVFWAMVIFAVVLLVFATIITMIKTHYNYNAKKSAPSYIIGKAIRGLIALVVIPFAVIFGIYLSQGVLVALDRVTSAGGGQLPVTSFENTAAAKFDTATVNGEKTYASFDYFGDQKWTTSYSFSSAIFVGSLYNANRVRNGEYTDVVGETNSKWSNMGVFWTDDALNTKETIAKQIDAAFEYSLTLKDTQSVSLGGDSASLITSYSGLSAIYALDLINVSNFSKFDVGLVWYYYNLWRFDTIIGFAGIITAVILMAKIILGLISRIIFLTAMFLVYPPITSLYPLDEGDGVKTWSQAFMKSYLSTFSAVVGINIVGVILPFIRKMSLFNNALLDAVVSTLFVLCGLMVVKKLISLFSSFIGAESAEEVGGKMAKEFTSTIANGVKDVLKLSGVGIAAGKSLKKSRTKKNGISPASLVTKGVASLGSKISSAKKKKSDAKKEKQAAKANADREQAIQSRINEKLNNTETQQQYYDQAKEKVTNDMFDGNESVFHRTRGNKNINKHYLKKHNMSKDDVDKMMNDEMRKAARIDAEKEQDKADAEKQQAEAKAEQEKQQKKTARRERFKNIFTQKVEPKEEGKEPTREMRPIIKEFLDMAKMTIKVQGDLTGISGLAKAISDTSADEFKDKAKKFAEFAGIATTGLQTKKEKEKADDAKAEALLAQKEDSVKDLAELGGFKERPDGKVEQTNNGQITQLLNAFKSYYKRKEEKEAKEAKSTTKQPKDTKDKK